MLTSKQAPARVQKEAERVADELERDPSAHDAMRAYDRAFSAFLREWEHVHEIVKAKRIRTSKGHYRDPAFFVELAQAFEDREFRRRG